MERMMEEIAEVEPLAVFERWLDEAWRGEPNAHAMTLATATAEGRPSARVVLLKGLDKRGVGFFTKLQSPTVEGAVAATRGAPPPAPAGRATPSRAPGPRTSRARARPARSSSAGSKSFPAA